ncbi:unnamed protein product, partial [Amoebophrya sp. A120]
SAARAGTTNFSAVEHDAKSYKDKNQELQDPRPALTRKSAISTRRGTTTSNGTRPSRRSTTSFLPEAPKAFSLNAQSTGRQPGDEEDERGVPSMAYWL